MCVGNRSFHGPKGLYSKAAAVIDNGIDTAHTEFSGQVSTTLNRDYVSDGDTVGDHATMIAGIIGAKANNEIDENGEAYGTVGVCWGISMVSLRAFNSSRIGQTSHIVSAINNAESYNFPIINYSAGSYSNDNQPIISAINNYSGLFVCAAGNDCFGRDEGTSYAAPYVAGVAALLLSVHPELTAAELRQVIMENVDMKSAYSGKCVSGGRLNAYKALSDDSIHSYTGNANGHSCSGTRCSYSEPHTYTVTRYNASQHKLYCTQCSYTTYANHTVRVGSTICLDCGYNTSGPGIMGVDDIICSMA